MNWSGEAIQCQEEFLYLWEQMGYIVESSFQVYQEMTPLTKKKKPNYKNIGAGASRHNYFQYFWPIEHHIFEGMNM